MIGKDIVLMLVVVFIFGTNFVAMKFGLEEIPPLMFVALRFTLVIFPLIFFLPKPNNKWYKVVAVGFFINTAQFAFLFIAMQEDISAGLASLLLQLQVPFTLILSYFALAEKINKTQFSGIVLALCGFLFFVFQEGGSVTIYGVSLVALAAFSWSIGNVFLKTSKKSNPLHLVVWSSLVAPLPLFALSFWLESSDPIGLISNFSFKSWASVSYVAFLTSVIGYSIWSKLMAKYSAIQVTPFALLIPIVGMLTGAIMLGESLNFYELFGTLVVLSGLALCVLVPLLKLKYTKIKKVPLS